MSQSDPQTTKAKAYGRYYLDQFRADAERKREALARSLARLEIAERQFAFGGMVTGTTSGIPVLLEGVLKA